jgi:hypothetical protein
MSVSIVLKSDKFSPAERGRLRNAEACHFASVETEYVFSAVMRFGPLGMGRPGPGHRFPLCEFDPTVRHVLGEVVGASLDHRISIISKGFQKPPI